MAAFEYVALDHRGKQRKGVLEGDTARQVRQSLREQSLTPMSVAQISGQKAAARGGAGDTSRPRFALGQSLSDAELALVTRQLATLVQAALPLEEAMQAIGDQSEKARTKRIVLGVRSRVREGYSLADSMSNFPHAFPPLFRATIDAGEQSGKLDGVLERLADYTEDRQGLAQKARTALIYPILLMVMSLGIVAFMLGFVVPKIVKVFETSGNELPLLTRLLLGASDFLQNWWWALIIGIVLIIVGVGRLLQLPGPKARWHAIQLRLPLVGRLTRGLNTARFMRTLSILASSGVPVLDSLRIAGEVINNVVMRRAVEDAAVKIREGASISGSLKAQNVFPPMTLHLLSSGEASGELDRMLERAAVNQEREMDALITGLMSIIEPVIIVVMGIVVLLIVLAILLPIFNMNQLLS